MQIHITQAKPYAKAIFDLALQNNQFTAWHRVLELFAKIAAACEEKKFLSDPRIKTADKMAFFVGVVEKLPEAMNLIRLLAERKKLTFLPMIFFEYQKLSLAYNKTIEVKVVSAGKLTDKQKDQISAALQKNHSGKVLLQYCIDDRLIGGAVIHLADRVIDGSVKGILQRLRDDLLLKRKHA